MEWTRERVGYLVVGFGVGALVDGFVLHQVLQWHHLWSARTPDTTVQGLEENTLADGIFHVAFLVALLAGMLMLVGRRIELRPLIGLGLIGWGVFHVLDQFVFHLALGAHHIRMVDNYQVYDWTFFAIGLALIAVGLVVARPTMRAGRASGAKLTACLRRVPAERAVTSARARACSRRRTASG